MTHSPVSAPIRGQVERNKRTTWLQASWYVSDLAAILCAFPLGYALRFHSPLATWIPPVNEIPAIEPYLLASVVAVLLWIPLFHGMGLYRVRRGRARLATRHLIRGLLFGILVLAAVGFFYRDVSFSRLAVLVTWGLACLLILLGRGFAAHLARRWAKVRPIRFATVGEGPVVPHLVRALTGSALPHTYVGMFTVTGAAGEPGDSAWTDRTHQGETSWRAEAQPPRPLGSPSKLVSDREASVPAGVAVATDPVEGAVGDRGRARAGARIEQRSLGSVEQLGERVRGLDLDLLVLTAPQDSPDLLQRLYLQCQKLDLDFQFVPGLLSLWTRPVRVEEVDGLPVLRLRELPLVGWNGVVKRALDLIISSCLLVLLSPLLLALAVAVRLDSPGPVFFRQERVGRDRRPFPMLKFRSMRQDAETTSGPVWATEGDPRRTRLGVFLRKWSLDELPQLINVFLGQMSLVGPRPERPFFVGQFETQVADYYDRHRIKSGMTGWAQVHGLRGQVPIEHRTRYDLYYIENWSLWLDLRILWMTVRAVVTHRGE